MTRDIVRYRTKLDDDQRKIPKRVDASTLQTQKSAVDGNGKQVVVSKSTGLSRPQRKVLAALGLFEDIEITDCASRVQVAFLGRVISRPVVLLTTRQGRCDRSGWSNVLGLVTFH